MAADRKLGAISLGLAAGVAAACLLAGVDAAAQGAVVDAVTTPGSGTLTMCRNWLVSQSCASYHRVALPERVAIGDKVKVRYGSNPKIYIFQVIGIRQHDTSCTILSEASGGGDQGERIEIAPCRPAAAPTGGDR